MKVFTSKTNLQKLFFYFPKSKIKINLKINFDTLCFLWFGYLEFLKGHEGSSGSHKNEQKQGLWLLKNLQH